MSYNSGDKYNKLTLVKFDHAGANYKKFWECLCECGNIKILDASMVKNGAVKSCGCLRKQSYKPNIKNHACKHCNKSKLTRSHEEFLNHILQSHIHLLDTNIEYKRLYETFIDRRK